MTNNQVTKSGGETKITKTDDSGVPKEQVRRGLILEYTLKVAKTEFEGGWLPQTHFERAAFQQLLVYCDGLRPPFIEKLLKKDKEVNPGIYPELSPEEELS